MHVDSSSCLVPCEGINHTAAQQESIGHLDATGITLMSAVHLNTFRVNNKRITLGYTSM